MKYVTIEERQNILKFNIRDEFNLALKYCNDKLHPVFNTYMDVFFKDFPLKGLSFNYQHFVDDMVNITIKQFVKEEDYESAFLCLCDFVINTHTFLKAKQIYGHGIYDNRLPDLNQFLKRISKVMHDLGYEFTKSTNNKAVYIIKEINIVADVVLATIKDPLITRNVIEYLRYGINVKQKQDILEDMYKHFEGLSIVGGQAIDTLKNLFNSGLRHTAECKIKNPQIFEYVSNNVNNNEFMDKNFNLFLECYLHSVNANYIKEIENISRNKKQ